MKISSDGLTKIKQREGLELKAYQDGAGVWTIGYGHTKHAVPGMTITEKQAEDWLRVDIQWAEDAVNKLSTVPLNRNMFDALVSLVFNIGVGAYENSTLLKRLNEGLYKDAAEQILVWNKITVKGKKEVSKGLDNRRKAEHAQFLLPYG